MKKASILALAAALAVAGAGHAGTNTFQPIDTSHGTVLTASNGMTLYTYEKDTRIPPIATASVPQIGHHILPTLKRILMENTRLSSDKTGNDSGR